MVRGTPRLLLRALMVLLTALALALGYSAWRISKGPWRVRFLSPVIAQALSDRDAKRIVTVGETVLIWRREERSVMVEVHDVHAADLDDHVTATVATALVRLSTRALLRGEFAVSQLEFVRPMLHLVRETSGDISFGIGEGEASTAGTTALVDQPVLKMIAGPDPATGRGRYLKSLRVIDGQLIVDDRRSQLQWDVPKISIDLEREDKGLGGEVAMDVALDQQTTHASAKVHYIRGLSGPRDARVVGDVVVEHLRLPALAARLPDLAPAAGVDLPLDIETQFALAGDFSLSSLAVAISSGPGRLVDPRLPTGAIALTAGSVGLKYDAAVNLVTLDKAELTLADGLVIMIAGTVADPLDKTDIAGTAQLAGVPLDDLPKLWPASVASHPRQWVLANLTRGIAREASAKFSLSRAGSDQPFIPGAVDGTISVERARVTYFGQLPAVENVAASATFNAARFDITVKSGDAQGMAVDGGQIAITGLEGNDHRISIGLDMHGPVPSALTILDANPLGYIKRFGMSPKAIGGDATVRLDLKFPLIQNLSVDQLQIAASASLKRLSVPNAVHGYALTEGDFALTLDGKGLQANGKGKLNDLPIVARWIENFAEIAPFRRRFEVNAAIDESSLSKFGVDLAPYLSGPVAGTMTYTERDGDKAELAALFDGRDAAAEIADLGWKKAAGPPLTAEFELGFVNGELAALSDCVVTGEGLNARLSGSFKPGGKLRKIAIAKLATGATDVTGEVVWRDVGGYDVALRGPGLDVSVPFNRPAAKGDDGEPTVPLAIKAKLDRLVLGPDRVLTNVDLAAAHNGARWLEASLEARTQLGKEAGQPVMLRLKPEGDGRRLTVTAADAGALLSAVGFTDYVKGGKLSFDAKLENQKQLMTGKATIQNYRVVRAPILASVLAIASVTGIPQLLTGEGIAFDNMTADITRTKDYTEIGDGRAAGLALGLTAQGRISRPEGILDLKGTIVPIYGINRVIGAIPLIGNLLTGGEGGGLFAWTYTIEGPVEKPNVSVNPLSALTPSFLRHIFELLDNGPSSAPGAKPTEEPAK
jgi:hypothetical protein